MNNRLSREQAAIAMDKAFRHQSKEKTLISEGHLPSDVIAGLKPIFQPDTIDYITKKMADGELVTPLSTLLSDQSINAIVTSEQYLAIVDQAKRYEDGMKDGDVEDIVAELGVDQAIIRKSIAETKSETPQLTLKERVTNLYRGFMYKPKIEAPKPFDLCIKIDDKKIDIQTIMDKKQFSHEFVYNGETIAIISTDKKGKILDSSVPDEISDILIDRMNFSVVEQTKPFGTHFKTLMKQYGEKLAPKDDWQKEYNDDGISNFELSTPEDFTITANSLDAYIYRIDIRDDGPIVLSMSGGLNGTHPFFSDYMFTDFKYTIDGSIDTELDIMLRSLNTHLQTLSQNNGKKLSEILTPEEEAAFSARILLSAEGRDDKNYSKALKKLIEMYGTDLDYGSQLKISEKDNVNDTFKNPLLVGKVNLQTQVRTKKSPEQYSYRKDGFIKITQKGKLRVGNLESIADFRAHDQVYSNQDPYPTFAEDVFYPLLKKSAFAEQDAKLLEYFSDNL